uniref:Protein SHORTAGE IN CHIASMATA 1 n=1 Tax=Kalanchoe fedtschenkoi TaxID=63787 RepID=A0A7N0U8W8_KALFE
MDVKLDMVKCDIQSLCLSQKSVYSVDSIQFDYYPDEEMRASEHDDSGQNHFFQFAFPHFEVDGTMLEIPFIPTIRNELDSLLRCMESEYQNLGGRVASDDKELLPYTGTPLEDTIQCVKLENLEMEGTDLVLEKDFIRMNENQLLQERSACSVEKLDGYYYISLTPVVFQEMQLFDIKKSPNIDVFLDYTNTDKPLNLCSLAKENLSVTTFDELIVSYELVLTDDAFRSLPVPMVSDQKAITLMQDIIWKVLAEFKPQPLSVSNDIYLDWHLLEDHKFNSDTSGLCEKLLDAFDNHHTDLELVLYDEEMSIFYLISEDTEIESVNEECKVSLNFVPGACFTSPGNISGVGVGKRLLSIPISGKGELLPSKFADVESIITKSVPQFTDLELFLNPQEATFGMKRVFGGKQFNRSVNGLSDDPNDCILLDTVPAKPLHHLDLRIHPMPLSDNILTLVSYFQKCYLAIIESITLLKTTHISFPFGDKSKLLRLSKQDLVTEIGAIIAQSTSGRDENILALLTLCAIKQLSWYLCFCGIHATHSYLDKLCSTLEFLRLRLCFLQSLISDALIETGKDITRSHPSLAKISEILSSKPSVSESKILIVIEQVLWSPLKILLTSIGITFKEVHHHMPSNHQEPFAISDLSKAMTDFLLNADCLIITHKSISAIFPFHKFGLILDYGGSHISSRISCMPQSSAGLPPLNFLKMELEHLDELKVFCENSEVPFSMGSTLEGHGTSLLETHGNINLQELEQVLNFIPGGEKTTILPSTVKIVESCTILSSSSEKAKSRHSSTTPLQSPHLFHKKIVNENHQGLSSYPEQIIVMNTKNLDKEMIMSRQSTYQKVLALEKEGVQVVERDSSLPADIILTASTCLVWYDSRNLLNKINSTEAFCLSSCIEHIATNVLTLLSFAFSGCYVVFEGNCSFSSSITEYADELYASAASLGMDIQMLYSHSSDLTDEIILNCIRSGTRFTKNLYPTMPESETFAECFLTKFPSINALSAHAIICSGSSLSGFFQVSPEVRLQALKKLYVPDVSISLLTAVCKFGEREDTRSGTTDCSSSVSSAPESEYFHIKQGLEGKKRKFSCSPPKDGILVGSTLQCQTLNTSNDASPNTPRVPAQFVSRMSVDPIESTDFANLSSGFGSMFFGPQGDGRSIAGDELCTNKFKSACTAEISTGEVDFNGGIYLGKGLFPFEKSRSRSPLNGKTKAPEPRNPRISRRLSFDAISDSTFSLASNFSFDLHNDNNARESEFRYTEANDINHFADLRSHDTPLEFGLGDGEGGGKRNAKGYHTPDDQEGDICCYGRTPLRNAIDSSTLQQSSPWNIEFLNRIREKSRAHNKSLSRTYTSNLAHRGTKHQTSKRKSPSIMDFYRYQGSSAQKFIERKTGEQTREPLGNTIKREDTSASRTPLDKRARKTLSFTTSKHGSQRKLMWLDGSI